MLQGMNLFPQAKNVPPPLYVGDLDTSVTEEVLHHHFSKYGPIFVIKIARDPTTQQSKGYGFVTFLNYHDAEKARQLCNYERILTYPNPIRVMWKRAPQDFSKDANIFVKDIPEEITPRELENLFRSCGQIHTIKIARNHNDPTKSLGYGYVQFNTEEEAQKCIQEYNGHEYNGRKISVEKFVPRGQREDYVTNQRNLFLKCLPRLDQNEIDKAIKEVYGSYGEISSIATRFDENHKGYFSFVCFKQHEDAKKAYDETNNTRIFDKYITNDDQKQSEPLYVNWAQKKFQRNQELKEAYGKQVSKTNVFLRSLLNEVTEEQLKQHFSQYGEITSIYLKESPINLQGSTGNLKFACLNFQESEQADNAVTNSPQNEEIKKLFHEGKPYITHHQPKDKRQEYVSVMRRTKMMFNGPFNFGGFGPMGMNPMMMGMGMGMGMGMPPMPFMPPPGMPNNMRMPPRMPMPPFGGAPGMPPPFMGGPGQGGRRGPPRGPPPGAAGMNMQMQGGRNMRPQQRGPPRGGMNRRPPYPGMQPRGMPPHAQGGMPPHTQGGIPPHAQGIPPHAQGGIPPQMMTQQQQQNPAQFISMQAKAKIAALRENMEEFLRKDKDEQRRILGDMLYPLIEMKVNDTVLAPKITGMLVDFDVMDVPDILELIEEEHSLHERIDEALELIKTSEENQ